MKSLIIFIIVFGLMISLITTVTQLYKKRMYKIMTEAYKKFSRGEK